MRGRVGVAGACALLGVMGCASADPPPAVRGGAPDPAADLVAQIQAAIREREFDDLLELLTPRSRTLWLVADLGEPPPPPRPLTEAFAAGEYVASSPGDGAGEYMIYLSCGDIHPATGEERDLLLQLLALPHDGALRLGLAEQKERRIPWTP